LPRHRCGAEEADEEPAIRGEILDAGAAELVELGKDCVLLRDAACAPIEAVARDSRKWIRWRRAAQRGPSSRDIQAEGRTGLQSMSGFP